MAIQIEVGGKEESISVSEAIEGTINDSSLLTDGSLESLESRIDCLTKIVAKLVENSSLSESQISELLGWGYSIKSKDNHYD